MESYTRTDLACESFPGAYAEGLRGNTRAERIGGFRVFELVLEKGDEARLDKPAGRYITVECGRIHLLSDSELAALTELLCKQLKAVAERLTKKTVNGSFGVFVAGLGNAGITADAIGPLVAGRLEATRHLREYERELYEGLGCAALSVLAPGVLGETGIETLELIKGAVEHVRPDLVIVIDALAARSCERLASTVQISDVGIVPGSGVGNHRMAITKSDLGVPVVSVGVPTVVNSATLVYDALRSAGIGELSQALEDVLHNGKSFFVSPKEIDVIVQSVSKLLSGAISMAFTGI